MKVPYVEYGWDNFPFERINCYFPEEGAEQMYVSDKNDTIVVNARKKDLMYYPKASENNNDSIYEGFTSVSEKFSAYQFYDICYQTGEDVCFLRCLAFAIDGRKRLNSSVQTNKLMYGLEVENSSSKPDQIFQYLSDTLYYSYYIENSKGDYDKIDKCAQVVKGKGIVMYKTINIDKETGKFLGFDET